MNIPNNNKKHSISTTNMLFLDFSQPNVLLVCFDKHLSFINQEKKTLNDCLLCALTDTLIPVPNLRGSNIDKMVKKTTY